MIIDLRMTHPELPVICDPSHIAGNTKYVASITQKAMDLCYDGLMIESHIHPNEALSDAQQQLTPSALKKLINSLSFTHDVMNDIEHLELLRLREKIDSIDSQLVELLSFRMMVVKQMAEYKQQEKIPILQLRRWHDIIESRLRQADSLNLNADFVKSLLEIIHLEAIRIQSMEHKNSDKDFGF
jgi:chorismate mutase